MKTTNIKEIKVKKIVNLIQKHLNKTNEHDFEIPTLACVAVLSNIAAMGFKNKNEIVLFLDEIKEMTLKSALSVKGILDKDDL